MPDDVGGECGAHRLRVAAAQGVEQAPGELVELLLERGATRDEDAFYHACEQSNTAFLALLHEPGFESMVNQKLDFEDAGGLRLTF